MKGSEIYATASCLILVLLSILQNFAALSTFLLSKHLSMTKKLIIYLVQMPSKQLQHIRLLFVCICEQSGVQSFDSKTTQLVCLVLISNTTSLLFFVHKTFMAVSF